MKTIGIVGSRRRSSPRDYLAVAKIFQEIYEPGDEIVSGGCPKGGDEFAERLAKQFQVTIKIYYAAWNRLGRGAGFARNSLIARDADVLIACVAGDRKGGTEDTISKFRKEHLYNPDKLKKLDADPNQCKGIIVRATVSEGFAEYGDGSRAFFHRKYLRILKKKSCPGCEKCGWFYEYAPEVHLHDFPLEGFEEIEDQKLYSIWGCGDEDDFHLCVKPYNEQ